MPPVEAPLSVEIDAYEKRRDELEKVYPGKFVVFKSDELIGAWDTFDAAAREAIARFGRGPYLIRQVGAPTLAHPTAALTKILRSSSNFR